MRLQTERSGFRRRRQLPTRNGTLRRDGINRLSIQGMEKEAMVIKSVALTLFIMASTLSGPLLAGSLEEIMNYREYSPGLSSAGQPSREQFELLKDEDFERVIYIAFANSDGAIPDEDQVVKELGMQYAQVPVIWDAPTKADFDAFAAVMQSAPDMKTLLHCQANYRATAFAFLYRVLYLDVPLAEAKSDMNTVWEPDGVWRDLIFEALEANGISPQCEGCDWASKD
jgi:protein tyrosine phosphatase (PTP) superfamily phosphohydrolase (DUF442 family)